MEPQVITLGETMVSLRSEGPLLTNTSWSSHIAGAETNVAIGLSRLGHRVGWCSRLGDDDFGRLIRRELMAEGVDISHVVTDADHPTGIMFARNKGSVTVVDYRRSGSAASFLTHDDITPALVASPQAVITSGVTLAISQCCRDTVKTVFSDDAHSFLRVFDVNYRSRLWCLESARENILDLRNNIDVLIASEEELGIATESLPMGSVLNEQDEYAAVQEIAQCGVSIIAIKRGSRGASLWFRSDGDSTAPLMTKLHRDGDVNNQLTAIDGKPLSVISRDPIGAGDAFVAGLMSGILDECSAHECLQRANAMGGHAVASLGDWEGLPTRSELLASSPDTIR